MAAATKADFEGDLDRLFQPTLSELTSARNELARELRAQGEREKADEIKQLRKPTAAVWLVNQLARERPLDVQRLLNAGEALTKSQAPEARRDEQRAVDQLAKGAREIAQRSGIGSAALGKVTARGVAGRAAHAAPDARRLGAGRNRRSVDRRADLQAPEAVVVDPG